jgi:zinc transporter 1
VLIVGGVGLASNLLSATILGGHAHHHHAATEEESPLVDQSAHADCAHSKVAIKKPARSMNLSILGALLHVLGDAINNIAVM